MPDLQIAWIGHAVNPFAVRVGYVVVRVAESWEDALAKAMMRLEAHAWSARYGPDVTDFSRARTQAAPVINADDRSPSGRDRQRSIDLLE
jgi:hypothetical protein